VTPVIAALCAASLQGAADRRHTSAKLDQRTLEARMLLRIVVRLTAETIVIAAALVVLALPFLLALLSPFSSGW
jgi:hypothetical protein